MVARPFVKWAGGKRKLLDQILSLAPKKYGTYHEPMVGGGAVFFALNPKRAILNDYNEELIETYKVVRDQPGDLIKAVRRLKNTEQDYLRIRTQRPKLPVTRAARFIYLNRFSFNGLYRVNASGVFNVPYCKDENRAPVDFEAIQNASLALQGVDIRSGDYLQSLTLVKPKDFVFIDPPYDNTFASYTSAGFNRASQIALKEALDYLTDLKAYAIICNSDTPFIRDIYRNYTKIPVTDRFVIASNGSKRGTVSTLFITNYTF
jgi:DNA adenine methylase